MYVPPWVVVTGIALIVVLALIALRARFSPRSKPANRTLTKQANPAVIESLRQNLRLKTGYNESLIDRLIEFERGRLPNAPLQTLMEATIERWERDNR